MTTPADSAPDPLRAPISRQVVVATALDLIDEQGYAALSMRGLAKRIGVYPATLYWHAGNKAQLLALVSDYVLRQIDVPSFDGTDWKGWFLELGRRSRRMFGQHPRFAGYFATNIQISNASLSMADQVVAVLSHAGFTGEELVRAYNAAFGSIFGWISGEFASDPQQGDSADLRKDMQNTLDALPDDALPSLREHLPLLSNRAWMVRWSSGEADRMDASFELMLRSVLDGIDAERQRRPGGSD